jgi:hypothetical protein
MSSTPQCFVILEHREILVYPGTILSASGYQTLTAGSIRDEISQFMLLRPDRLLGCLIFIS